MRKGGEKMSNEWLTINELSGRLKVSTKTVRNRMADGCHIIRLEVHCDLIMTMLSNGLRLARLKKYRMFLRAGEQKV